MASRTAPILFALLLASGAEAKTPHRAGCDRACLTALADRYVDALAAQKPADLPWASVVRASENNVPITVGDGIWATASAHSQAALKAADPTTGQAVWMGEVEEHGQPAFLAVRLRVEDGKIYRIEAIFTYVPYFMHSPWATPVASR